VYFVYFVVQAFGCADRLHCVSADWIRVPGLSLPRSP
jgi:hypothetical protein